MYPVYYVYWRSRDRERFTSLHDARRHVAHYNKANNISDFEYLGIIRVSNLGRALAIDYKNNQWSSLMEKHAHYHLY